MLIVASRCKKVGIELSKGSSASAANANNTNNVGQWNESDMTRALRAVRTGGMSINQAAISHNLPYSSLYGRINRLKRDQPGEWGGYGGEFLDTDNANGNTSGLADDASSVTAANYAAAAAAAAAAAFISPPEVTSAQ